MNRNSKTKVSVTILTLIVNKLLQHTSSIAVVQANGQYNGRGSPEALQISLHKLD